MSRALPSPTPNSPSEGLLGLHAVEGSLTAYGFSRGQYVRSVFPINVEEEGTAVVNRAMFFKLLSTLKGSIVIKRSSSSLTPNRLEVVRVGSSGKFTLNQYESLPTKPSVGLNCIEIEVPNTDVLKILKFCSLDGELLGGGYKVERCENTMQVIVSDKLRLIIAKMRSDGDPFQVVIPPSSIKGVFETLKLLGKTTLVTGTNAMYLRSQCVAEQHEFGFLKEYSPFPDLSKITDAKLHPNIARFEVAELIDAVKQSLVLADNALAFADFTFDGEFCSMTTLTGDTSADIDLCAPAEIEESKSDVLRLRLDFVLSFLKKAEEGGVSFVNVQWSEKFPVNWTPDFDEPRDIDFRLICAALNRGAKY
jgi:DNA polymerase III sliding clamp (beta) subunit (PCNA family)